MGVVIPQVVSEDRASGGQVIDGSLRFNEHKEHFLYRNPTQGGNRWTWTYSVWIKRGKVGVGDFEGIFGYTSAGTSVYSCLLINSDGQYLDWWDSSSSGSTHTLKTKNAIRDTHSWYHIVLSVDYARTTASEKVKIYLNGVECEYQTDNRNLLNGTAGTHLPVSGQNIEIGSQYAVNTARRFEGQMSQSYYIDGQCLGPNWFGYTDPLTGIWRPKAYKNYWSDNVGSGSNVIFSSEQSSDGQVAANVFDGNLGNNLADRWRNNGSEDGNLVNNTYIGCDFGSGVTKDIRKIRLLQGRPGNTGEMVSGVKVQYSDNGSAWSDAGSAHALNTSTHEWEDLIVTPSGSHRYWRLLCSSTSNSVWCVTEMTVHEHTETNDYGKSGHYLPFDGDSPIIQDQSGNGNDWIPMRGIGSSVPIEKATGALPIYNTKDGGAIATSTFRTDPFAANIIFAMPCCGPRGNFSARDYHHLIKGSGTAKSMSKQGDPLGYAGYQSPFYNTSFHFDGNDYIDSLDLTDFNTANDWTIEFWWFKTNTSSSNHGHWLAGQIGGSNKYGPTWRDNDDDWQLNYNGVNIHFDDTIHEDEWHHYAFVRDGNTIRYFRDGNQIGSASAGGMTGSWGSNTEIGRGAGGWSSQYPVGYISDYRIYTAAKYTTHFTVPSLDPDILPSSPSGITHSAKPPIEHSGSVYFYGNNDYLSVPDHADLEMGSSDWTIDAWVYPMGAKNNGGYGYIYNKGYSFQFAWMNNNGGSLSMYASTLASGGYDIVSNANLADGRVPMGVWTHVRVCRSGNNVYTFANGDLVNTSGFSGTVYNNNDPVTIGTYGPSTQNYEYKGWISNVRFIKGTALSTSDFVVPTAPLENITNTKLLCCNSTTSTTSATVSPTSISQVNKCNASAMNPFDDGRYKSYVTDWPRLNAQLPGSASAGEVADGGLEHMAVNYSMWKADVHFGAGGIHTGKWYWEITFTQNDNNNQQGGSSYHPTYTGLTNDLNQDGGEVWGETNKSWCGGGSYKKYTQNNSTTSFTSDYHQGQTLGFAYDCDNRTIYYYVDGCLEATDNTLPDLPTINDADELVPFTMGTNDGASGANWMDSHWNFGQRPFRYRPLGGGYQPLASANVTANAITDNTRVIKPSEHFKVIEGTNQTSVTGVGFKPSLIWSKSKTQGYQHYMFDTPRGVGKLGINPNQNTGEGINDARGIASFDSDGVTWETTDGGLTQTQLISWCWKGGHPDAIEDSNLACVTFDGSGDTLRCTSTGLPKGASNRTIEFWGWIDLDYSSWQNIFSYGAASAGQCFGMNTSSSNTGTFRFTGYGSGDWDTGVVVTPYRNQWHHYCWTYDGSTLNFYIDGESKGTVGKTLNTTGTVFPIGGSEHSGFGENFKGKISNFRISNNVRYSANFIPSNQSLTSDGNTVLLCCQDSSDATVAVTKPGALTAHGNAAATNADGPIKGFAKDGVVYATPAEAGLGAGNLGADKLISASVNTKAGFSIINYWGNGGNSVQIPHGLTKSPKWIFVDNRRENGKAMICWTRSNRNKSGYVNGTAAFQNNNWAHNAFDEPHLTGNYPNDNVFFVSASGNTYNSTYSVGDRHQYIAYLWHDVPGYCKTGYTITNGSGDGPFVDLGFKPALIILKPDATADWLMYSSIRNPFNPAQKRLKCNNANTEQNISDDSQDFDILSNGFKYRDSTGAFNESGKNVMYIAWADETPMAAFGARPTAY